MYIRYSGKVQQMILKWVCECVCECILPQTKTLYCSGSIWNESPSIHYRLSCIYTVCVSSCVYTRQVRLGGKDRVTVVYNVELVWSM